MFGNPGSGKTACMVREMKLNPSKKTTFSNIITKGIKNNVVMNSTMIIKKEKVGEKKSGEIVYKKRVNKEFWEEAQKKYGNINVIIDEAHTILNARRAISKNNVIMSDFMAMLRRILGSGDSGYGELVLISQLERRIDVIAKEMCTQTRFHVCHYKKSCKQCGLMWDENNETPEPFYACPKCKSAKIIKHSHIIEVWHFRNPDLFVMWKYYGKKSYYRHYLINDIEKYFNFYNTLQWENLLTED